MFCCSAEKPYFCHIMNICVFCSANSGIDPEYFRLTRELGLWAARSGHRIVFGGTDQGLMECLAEAVSGAGGTTIGVVPLKVEERGRVSRHLSVHIPCSDLTDRKELMACRSDVFIALPGGIGTLDEVFTVAASASIGYHRKRVILYNMGGFWNSLIALLDDLQARGLMRAPWTELVRVAGSIEDIEREIAQIG